MNEEGASGKVFQSRYSLKCPYDEAISYTFSEDDSIDIDLLLQVIRMDQLRLDNHHRHQCTCIRA